MFSCIVLLSTWFFFHLDNQSDNTIKKRTFIKRSNSDSDITYCYLFQKYSETDTVFNITGILLKIKTLILILYVFLFIETPTADDFKYSWKDEKSSKCLFNIRKCHSLENLTQLLSKYLLIENKCIQKLYY